MLRYSISFLLLFSVCFAQTPDSSKTDICKKKQIITLSTTGALYIGGMAGLYQLWYAGYPQTSFQFFNDNDEWLQMDKVGHTYSNYHITEFGYKAAKFSCFNETQSIWLGGGFGLLFLLTIEIFDGFSAAWGASWGDMIANTGGYLLFTTQQQFWQEQKFRMKFSYSPSKYAQYRPELMGNSFATSLLKDYNAQTYWLSFSPASFVKQEDTKWPRWLCLSFGYSGDGMTGGSFNPREIDGVALPHFDRQRQFYLSLDIDFSKINTNSKALKTVFYGLNLLKFPFPAISYDKGSGVKGSFVHF